MAMKWGMPRNLSLLPSAALLSLTLLVSGCSSSSVGVATTAVPPAPAPSDAAATPPPAPPASSPSLKDKIANFFSGSSAKGPQAVANAQPDVDCPFIDIRQGASTLTIPPPPPDGGNEAMTLKYQGTFVRAARECALVTGNVVMKIGVEGRVIIGPSGGPGQIDVPLRIAVVEETTAHTKLIFTKLIRIPVTVASATENPTFTHIEEGVTFPMPANLDNYIVYIGFDPIAAAAQDHPKPAPKPKPKAKPAKTG